MSPLFEVLRRWPEGFERSVPEGGWVEDAIRHGVAPWVTESLAKGQQLVPDPLSAAARAQLGQGRRHRRFTLDVVSALNAAGLEPLLLKGYGLAMRIYPDAPLSRPASDVDVYVRPAEEARALSALRALGFQQQVDAGLADAHEHHHTSWVSREGLVEVHHRLASGFGGRGYDDAAMALRAVPATLEGQRVQYLATEDELLYLAVHAATHSFLRVSWLFDLRQFITARPSLDWDLLLRRAREVEVVRPLRAALLLARRLVGARVPPQVESRWSLRSRTDALVFAEDVVASAQWSSQKVPAFLLHLYLSQTPGQVVRHTFAGLQRALRRARADGNGKA